jgi:nucleotide-binding universal stress UspA family protein
MTRKKLDILVDMEVVKMFRRILFPTDFSDVSLYILENCIPKLNAREILVVHVIEYIEDLSVLETLQSQAKEKMDKIISKLKEKGVNASGYVTIGGIPAVISKEAKCPSIEILDKAYCEGVDAIVIPSRGKHARRTMTIGSTALNVVRKSTVPVLVLRCDYRNGEILINYNCEKIFSRPLIALDLSPCSDLVVNAIRHFEDAVEKCIFLHVVDYGDIDEIEKNIQNAKKALEVYVKKFKFESEIVIETGIASKEILAKAIEHQATLIVIGKTGRGLLKELLLGSTATAIVKESTIPTLTIPCK